MIPPASLSDPSAAAGWRPDGRGWFVRRAGATFTLARRVPLRWDLTARTRLPDGMGRRRLAHAIRQDLWRMLRDLRGFAPAVEVTRSADGLDLRAGGDVDGRMPAAGTEARIAALLAAPQQRMAWHRAARHGRAEP